MEHNGPAHPISIAIHLHTTQLSSLLVSLHLSCPEFLSSSLHRRPGVVKSEQGSSHLTRQVRRAGKLVEPTRIRLSSWNVGSLTGRLRELVDSAIRRHVNILCVQETKWKGQKHGSYGGKVMCGESPPPSRLGGLRRRLGDALAQNKGSALSPRRRHENHGQKAKEVEGTGFKLWGATSGRNGVGILIDRRLKGGVVDVRR